MPLILIDALPSGQVLINTDQIVQARHIDGGVSVILTDGNEVRVPHGSVHDLLDSINEGIEAATNPTVPI